MAITSWKNLVLPRLPGATEALVEEEVKKTIENFCRESTAWRDMLYGFDITAGNREVPVIDGDGTQREVIQLLRVYYERRQLTPYSHVPWETSTNSPTGWSTKADYPATINLSTIPTKSITDALSVWAVVRPIDPETITNMEILENDFWEVIYDGVLGRMYSQKEKPYTDSANALYHLQRYRNGTRKARDMANRGFTANAQNWTFPNFGR